MSGDQRRLVVYRDGTEVGSITADGEITISESASNYVCNTLRRYKGGDCVAHEIGDGPGHETKVSVSTGESLFESVRGRFSELSIITTETHERSKIE